MNNNIESMTKNEIAVELEEVHGVKLSNNKIKGMKKGELVNLLKRERWEREIEAADKEDAVLDSMMMTLRAENGLESEPSSQEQEEQQAEEQPEQSQEEAEPETPEPEQGEEQPTEQSMPEQPGTPDIPETTVKTFHLILEIPEFYHDFFTLQIMVQNMVKNKVAEGYVIRVHLNGTESKSVLYAINQLGFDCTFDNETDLFTESRDYESFGVIVFTNNTMLPKILLTVTEWLNVKAAIKVFNYETKLWMKYEHIVSYIQGVAGATR